MEAKDSKQGYAILLGVTMDEYLQLKHGPLLEFKNSKGKTVSYMIHLSPENPPELHAKLCPGNTNFIQFTLRQIEKLKDTGVDLFPETAPEL